MNSPTKLPISWTTAAVDKNLIPGTNAKRKTRIPLQHTPSMRFYYCYFWRQPSGLPPPLSAPWWILSNIFRRQARSVSVRLNFIWTFTATIGAQPSSSSISGAVQGTAAIARDVSPTAPTTTEAVRIPTTIASALTSKLPQTPLWNRMSSSDVFFLFYLYFPQIRLLSRSALPTIFDLQYFLTLATAIYWLLLI